MFWRLQIIINVFEWTSWHKWHTTWATIEIFAIYRTDQFVCLFWISIIWISKISSQRDKQLHSSILYRMTRAQNNKHINKANFCTILKITITQNVILSLLRHLLSMLVIGKVATYRQLSGRTAASPWHPHHLRILCFDFARVERPRGHGKSAHSSVTRSSTYSFSFSNRISLIYYPLDRRSRFTMNTQLYPPARRWLRAQVAFVERNVCETTWMKVRDGEPSWRKKKKVFWGFAQKFFSCSNEQATLTQQGRPPGEHGRGTGRCFEKRI